MSVVARETIAIIAAILRADPQHITPAARLAHDLGADSLDSVALVMAIEDRFSIDMPDEDVEQLRTVHELIEYVELALAVRQRQLQSRNSLQEQFHGSTGHRDYRS
jgi:acyl carrier protein